MREQMAKQSAGVPFLVGGMATREQIWQTLEGLYNLGISDIRITAPPRPVALQAKLDGELALLSAPEKQRKHNRSSKGDTVLMRLAKKGGPFSFGDVGKALARAGLSPSPSGIIRRAVERGDITKLGTSQYVIAGAVVAPPVHDRPKKMSGPDMVESMLRAAYPKPLKSLDMRAAMKASGRRKDSGSGALTVLTKRKLVKNVGKGLWLYTPPKGAKK